MTPEKIAELETHRQNADELAASAAAVDAARLAERQTAEKEIARLQRLLSKEKNARAALERAAAEFEVEKHELQSRATENEEELAKVQVALAQATAQLAITPVLDVAVDSSMLSEVNLFGVRAEPEPEPKLEPEPEPEQFSKPTRLQLEPVGSGSALTAAIEEGIPDASTGDIRRNR